MKSKVYQVLNIQPMNCMKMHYTISTNDDRVIIYSLNAMMHAVEFQETFACNALHWDVNDQIQETKCG